MRVSAKTGGILTAEFKGDVMNWSALHEQMPQILTTIPLEPDQDRASLTWADLTKKQQLRIYTEYAHLGRLVVRMQTIPPPEPMKCKDLACARRFMHRALLYSLVCMYHKLRVGYVMLHRQQEIPGKYRTGDPAPATVRQAVAAITKLKLYVAMRR